MKAMILAAGKGERMRPLTLHTPKPLLEVKGLSLIEHHIFALKKANITEVVINVSWLGDKIITSLGDGSNYGISIKYSKEPEPLETAGGIRNALPLINPGSEPFLVVNGDIYCDYDFTKLESLGDTDGHLVLVKNPVHNKRGDFSLNKHKVEKLSDDLPAYTFAGISLLTTHLINHYDPEEQKLGPILKLAASKGRLTGEQHLGVWHDVGTPERLANLNEGEKID